MRLVSRGGLSKVQVDKKSELDWIGLDDFLRALHGYSIMQMRDEIAFVYRNPGKGTPPSPLPILFSGFI